MKQIEGLLAKSQSEHKGLTFFVGGQTVAGVVLKVEDGVVTARSQQHSVILIRVDRIDALAMA